MLKTDVTAITGSVFDLIGKQWMLITAASNGKANSMTASWGGLGEMWGAHIAFCVIRPQRYTFELMEAAEQYTLSFLPGAYKDAHKVFGSESGRNTDKYKKTGLTLVNDGEFYHPAEAELVLCIKKLYRSDLTKESFVTSEIPDKIYPAGDFHRVYAGEIVSVLTAKGE